MTDSPKTLLNVTNVQLVASILLKSSENRTEDEINLLIETLESLEYFRTHVSDPSERKEFIRAASQYLEYSFYAKGAAICHHGDLPPDFGIILSGSALVYEPKTKEQFDSEVSKSSRIDCLDIYKQYARTNGVFRKFRRLQSLSPARHLERSLTRTPDFSNYELEALKIDEPIQENAAEEILKHPNNILPYSLLKYDLTLEEKFLFLINGEGVKNYFREGKSTHKKRRELKTGMSVLDIVLTTSLPCEYTILASEELHLITLKKESFMLLYKDKSSQYQKKRKFLSTVFPSLPYDAILRLSAYVEERVFHNWEYIYEEGDKSDGIYIVKTGEVQLLKFDEEEKGEKSVPCSLVLKDRSKGRFLSKQKLNATKLNVGGVFGEEEIIKRTTRRISAKCNGSFTLLYAISSQIYTEMIEKHFPLISEVLKAAMDPKSHHRNERIQKGQKLAAELIQQEELAKDFSDFAAEKIPEEFSKKRGLFIDLSESESAVCEERISRMTKKKVEIKIRKGKEIKIQQLSNLVAPLPKGDEKRSLSKSPKNELYFSSGPEDLENMKSKLFKKYQAGQTSKNHSRKSSYYFPEESKAKTFRPSTSQSNVKAIFKPSLPKSKTDKSQNESRTAFSLVLDGMSEEMGPIVKNVSSFFQATTQTPKKANLSAFSSYSFTDILRKNSKNSVFDNTSQISLASKQSQPVPQIRAFNFNDHPISSVTSKILKKTKLPIMEEIPKESSLVSIPTLNFEPSESMIEIGVQPKIERTPQAAFSTRWISETNKVFLFNKGQGETKATVVKSQTPKSMILDGNYNHLRKSNSKPPNADRITFRKCSIES